MQSLYKPAIAVAFLAVVAWYVDFNFGTLDNAALLIFAAIVGGYMALNIGANDVANNVGPAVGAYAITLGGAVLIAAIFEASGALIAGGDVVQTVKKGIIDPLVLGDGRAYIWAMTAALLGAAIWLNVATALGAPVSTTHSIVGGVMGAGIAAAGWGAVNWTSMAAIASSWVISPVLGGVIAATLLLVLQRRVYMQNDLLGAAQKIVPLMTALMALAFTAYLVLKGLKQIVKLDLWVALVIGAAVAAVVYVLSRRQVLARVTGMDPTRDNVNLLFTVPLIFGAALLSFAHGANDVTNAVGPLAGIFDAANLSHIHI